MKLRSGISDDNCVDFLNAQIIKNAVLSALDLPKTPNVQHFARKKADSRVLFSGFGVFAWEVLRCENTEIIFPYCTGPRRIRPKSLKTDSPVGNEGDHAEFGTRIFPHW